MDKSLRDEATSAAVEMGFSSLQEFVRVFLQNLAKGSMSISFEPAVKLSDKNERRYEKMLANIESGKVKTKTFTDFVDIGSHNQVY